MSSASGWGRARLTHDSPAPPETTIVYAHHEHGSSSSVIPLGLTIEPNRGDQTSVELLLAVFQKSEPAAPRLQSGRCESPPSPAVWLLVRAQLDGYDPRARLNSWPSARSLIFPPDYATQCQFTNSCTHQSCNAKNTTAITAKVQDRSAGRTSPTGTVTSGQAMRA